MLSEEQIEDKSRAEQLVQRLHFMEIAYAFAPIELGGKESRQKWKEHFQRTLSYAEHGKYKDYVKLLRKEKGSMQLTEDDVPF